MDKKLLKPSAPIIKPKTSLNHLKKDSPTKKVQFSDKDKKVEKPKTVEQKPKQEIEENKLETLPESKFIPVNFYEFAYKNETIWPEFASLLTPVTQQKAKINDILRIVETIILINFRFETVNINALRNVLNGYSHEIKEKLTNSTFPILATLTLDTEHIFYNGLPFLDQRIEKTISLTKKQVLCLLANMFWCTIIGQKREFMSDTYCFSKWYRGGKDKDKNSMREEKIKCLISYFIQNVENISGEYIVFKRLVLDESKHGEYHQQAWESLEEYLYPITFKETGKIEDSNECIHIDFANKFLGGGTLGNGMVQEEIMFTTTPECIASVLFTECLTDREAILIHGARDYCSYKGYKSDFQYAGPSEKYYRITQNVAERRIIAIDAIRFGENADIQFQEKNVMRELNKAYVGFFSDGESQGKVKIPISTGKWGCGAFHGDVHLKFLIQWMAASRTKREMIFYSFGDEKLKNVEKIIEKYKEKTVGELMKDIIGYCQFKEKSNNRKIDLFTSLLQKK